MEDIIIMMLTEERKSTIKFGSKFTHVDYFGDNKVIIAGFKSPREAKLFHNAIVNKYIAMFKVERSISAVMLSARDSVNITNVTIDDSLSWLSISLSHDCSFIN